MAMEKKHSTDLATARTEAGSVRFATTCWTLIRQAQAAEASPARGLLYGRYWKPLAAFLTRLGVRGYELQDITQGFFLSIEERNDIARLDPARGRFRSWLRSSARHYLLGVRKKQRGLRAGGGVPLLNFDTTAEAVVELRDELDPEQLASEREALDILTRAGEALRLWYEAQGKLRIHNELIGSLCEHDAERDVEIARRLGKTSGAIGQDRFRMRARFAQCVKAELRRRGVRDSEMRDRLQRLEASLSPDEPTEGT